MAENKNVAIAASKPSVVKSPRLAAIGVATSAINKKNASLVDIINLVQLIRLTVRVDFKSVG